MVLAEPQGNLEGDFTAGSISFEDMVMESDRPLPEDLEAPQPDPQPGPQPDPQPDGCQSAAETAVVDCIEELLSGGDFRLSQGNMTEATLTIYYVCLKRASVKSNMQTVGALSLPGSYSDC